MRFEIYIEEPGGNQNTHVESKAKWKILYSPDLINDGYAIFNANLNKERNEIETLDFAMLPSHPLYNSEDLEVLRTILRVYLDGECIFRGRISSVEEDFYKNRKYSCESELVFLKDINIRPGFYDGELHSGVESPAKLIEKLLDAYNSACDISGYSKHFAYAYPFDPELHHLYDPYRTIQDSYDYMNIWDIFNDHIFNENPDISIWADSINESVAFQWDRQLHFTKLGDPDNPVTTIEFGRNLLDLSKSINTENVYTAIIPLGREYTDDDVGFIAGSRLSLDGGSFDPSTDRIVSSLASDLGMIEHVEIFDGIEDIGDLRDAAYKVLNDNIIKNISIEINAVDLSFIDPNAPALKLGDYARVISIPHGIDSVIQCEKISYSITSPENTQYTFGQPIKSLSQKISDTNMRNRNKFNEVRGSIIKHL